MVAHSVDDAIVGLRRGAVAARRAHNPEVVGSSPSAATKGSPGQSICSGLGFAAPKPIFQWVFPYAYQNVTDVNRRSPCDKLSLRGSGVVEGRQRPEEQK